MHRGNAIDDTRTSGVKARFSALRKDEQACGTFIVPRRIGRQRSSTRTATGLAFQ
jgi:hypothetical protein